MNQQRQEDSTGTLELLAPAGDQASLRAAIENGADAVYFGLERGFNARYRATNLSLETLPQVMETLHRRRVKGYVALNTLVFSGELAEFERVVRQVAQAGVDAVLVQDVGAASLIRRVCSDLSIHASTQMTMTSAECIDVIGELGIDRVVLARELSLAEIQSITRATSVPVEVFVHGALCVAYSGQCLTSESLGGRSANRGQCAQACRLPYDLFCDGQLVDLGDQKYLLSPQDLAAYDLIPELLRAGVSALKIEGRLKSAEYVANITRHYRRAIDAVLEGTSLPVSAGDVEEMELSFSRGFSHGWLDGCDHKRLVPALSSAKRGVCLGKVMSVRPGAVRVGLERAVRAGDGVVFESEHLRDAEQGGRVYEVIRDGRSVKEPVAQGLVELTFRHGSIDWQAIRRGQRVWKTDDPQLTRRLRQTYAGDRPQFRRPINLSVRAVVGEPLVVDVLMGDEAAISIQSPQILEQARRHVLTAEVLRQQFDRLGGTAYRLGDLRVSIHGDPMVPLSVLGQLRHELVKRLDDVAVASAGIREMADGSVLSELRPRTTQRRDQVDPRLSVLCRSLDQVAVAAQAEIEHLVVDFADIRQYREAVEVCRQYRTPISLATPRIQKPGELGVFRALLRPQADSILARNLAAIRFFVDAGVPVVADYSLNVTNELTASWLKQLGVQRMTASYDLNREQLLDFVGQAPSEWLEVVVHQHMPMFHMEHCVFCAVLSPGTNKTNCGRPCDEHQVHLRDRVGMRHLLTADVGCRNTLFNAVPQSAAEAVPALLAAGIAWFRLEFLETSDAESILETISLYRGLLRGECHGADVWTRLKALNRVGLTRGTLETARDPLAII